VGESGGAGERDDELVVAARRGEGQAFESLLDRHQGKVLRVLRLLGVRPEDREDVAQEVFVRVFRHLEGFRTGESFSAWIYRIDVNASHDHRRQIARRRESSLAPEHSEQVTDSGTGPEEAASRIDRRRRLEEALGALSERERAVFVLCEMEGLPTRGVARSLGITSITVRRHLGRARSRLRAELNRMEKKRAVD
jgi:RNA polymerase sigma-70 factor (ECF subfamily)